MDKEKFKHPAIDLRKNKKIVFIAMSKSNFYFRRHAIKFVLGKDYIPISPYGIFDYFLSKNI